MIKYVFFGSDYSATNRLFNDLKLRNDVMYINAPIKNRIIRFAFKVHFSSKINKYIKLPFKKVWRYCLIKKLEISDDDKIYFIYCRNWINSIVQMEFVKFCNFKFKKSNHTLYFTDIHGAREVDMEKLKMIFDNIYIFDKSEAKKLNIKHYPLPYSKLNISQDIVIDKDVAFVGRAKSRYKQLIEIYDILTFYGLKCEFYIIDIPRSQQIKKNGLHYTDFIPYEDTLEIIRSARCGIELKIDDCESYSNRVYEAIVNNRLLLTNNSNVKINKYYSEKYMQVFSDVKNINIEFFKINQSDINYNYNNDYSPINFLDEIVKVNREESLL